MADSESRVLKSYTDVLAVEREAPGMVNVVTLSDSYTVDTWDETCECADYRYNLDGQGRCKHLYGALRETEQLPCGALTGYDDSLDGRPSEKATPTVADGGQDKAPRPDCDRCGDDLACPEHYGLIFQERRRPTRSEPADFGGGESTGVQSL